MKNGRIFKASLWLAFIMSLVFAGCGSKTESPDPAKAYVQSLYGENRELAYVFNNLEETIYTGDQIDPELADLVQRMQVGFVRTGDPGTEDAEWPLYQTDSRSTMIFDTRSRVENDPLKEQREILTPLIEKYASDLAFAFDICVDHTSNMVELYELEKDKKEGYRNGPTGKEEIF